MIGGMVGSYRILRQLGEGGMGTVYEGLHEQIQRRAAIKVLHTGIAHNPEIAARFFNEARSVNLIPHPGIVQIYEFGQMPDGTAFIIMEFLDGESLTARVRRMGRLAEPDALRLARQVASVLTAAHEARIVHRDLKPDNVMIVRDPESPGGERAKVLDFGIAKVSEAHAPGGPSAHRTSTQAVMGTPAYMSPEQCQGAAQVDDKTDVYALGVMLFQMLSGQLPFDAPSVVQLMYAHMTNPPPPLETVAPDVSPGAAALVGAMLVKDPRGRPSMRDVVGELERLGAPGQGATGPSFPHANVPPTRSSMPRIEGGRRSGKVVAIAVVSAAAIAGVIAAVIVAGGKGGPGVSGAGVDAGAGAKPNPQDPARTCDGQDLALCEKWCNEGNASSCYLLGLAYRRGKGVTRDYSRAFQLFQRSCEQNEAGGCLSVALAYEAGQGVGQDYARAIADYERLCDADVFMACSYLGSLLAQGKGTKKDYTRALELLVKACNGKDPWGCGNLATLYDQGHGVRRDLDRAVELYQGACDADVAFACNSLATLYYEGRGVAKDRARATNLYQKTCDAGDSNGCYLLGLNYKEGGGVARDVTYARTLFGRACDAGHDKACKELDRTVTTANATLTPTPDRVEEPKPKPETKPEAKPDPEPEPEPKPTGRTYEQENDAMKEAVRKRDWNKALEHALAAVKIEPRNQGGIFNCVFINCNLGRGSEAKRWFQKLSEDRLRVKAIRACRSMGIELE